MGRFWLGVILLVTFLVLGLWTGVAVAQINAPISRQLEAAAAASLAGDPEDGFSFIRQAHTLWEKNRHLLASVADHAPMDEIDSLFAQAETLSQAGKDGEFAACCMRLSQLVQAISEAHSLQWWNFL